MEDVLEVYHRPYDPERPLVCFDEGTKQQVKETRWPLPLRPGQAAKYDYEYERNGTSNLFMFFAPLEAWRHLKVTDQRTMLDWAHGMRDLVDVHCPDAETMVVVMDNLNIHRRKSLTDVFGVEIGGEIWGRFTVHFTPTHGSWLNQAEIEIGMFSRQCLGTRRIPDLQTLRVESRAWNRRMNRDRIKINWKFDRRAARRKFGYKRKSFTRSYT